jgi:hypothetical protein
MPTLLCQVNDIYLYMYKSSVLVAWENCCTTKDLGGIGIKDFGTQNICLLLKLIHRLHCSESSAWGTWVRQHANLATLKVELLGQHWDILRSILPPYQALTTVDIMDSSATSFWNDVWHLDALLTIFQQYTVTAPARKTRSGRRCSLLD